MIPASRSIHRHRRLAAVLLFGAAMAATLPAAAQDMGTLLNRLNRLENEVDTLNRQVYRGSPPPASAAAPAPGGSLTPGNLAADFEVRLSRLEREIATLTGRNEELQYGLTQTRQRLEKMQEDLEIRLQELDQKLAGAPAGSPSAQPAAGAAPAARPPQQAAAQAPAAPAGRPDAQAQLPAGNAQEQYDRAFQMLRSADYAKAEQAFAQFVKANPNHSLTPNAQYWLAETYYARNQFRQAAEAYGEGYQKAPKGPKAPDNLLKLGLSLSALGRKDDACLAFAQLGKAFPDAPATIKRRADQERGRLNCS
ncbi:tol-pal system protein YbgF [Arenibaculum pallidiluteum]|uniref:tol-pal system protein YbgF n=1 Tax=Arenibaculum pallidiluteum TaxID=2812559 RepID=UPI001A964F57|nr:tol-pal system protein YbgF [Arenibaculum pallidiluteum]